MTAMQGDWHDYGYELCATALDHFVIDGYRAVFRIGIALLRFVSNQILKAKDICELNQVMVAGLRQKFEAMEDKVSFFDLVC